MRLIGQGVLEQQEELESHGWLGQLYPEEESAGIDMQFNDEEDDDSIFYQSQNQIAGKRKEG